MASVDVVLFASASSEPPWALRWCYLVASLLSAWHGLLVSPAAPAASTRPAPFTRVASSRVCAITGAQDVSNALGTSVGSKALTVRQAIVVGAICEFLGSLVGGEVAATISGGILNMDAFHALGPAGIDLYANCMFVTMCGAFTWLVIATIYGLPVSTTHSLVGSLVGVGCVAMDPKGVNWASVGRIGKL